MQRVHASTILPIVATVAVAACRPAAPADTPEGAADAPAPAAEAPGAATSTVAAACSGELVPAEDGMIDDFEDGNGQISVTAGRDGYWWTSNDDKGSEFASPGGDFAPEESAGHVSGQTASGPDAWGAKFGANLVSGSGALYDASQYAGIRFRAKAGAETKKVRLSLGDVNTHQDAGVCKQCWNFARISRSAKNGPSTPWPSPISSSGRGGAIRGRSRSIRPGSRA